MDPLSVGLVTGWFALHIIALFAACLTRIAAGSACEGITNLFFFAAMTVIGTMAWIAQQLDVSWTWSGITLMIMVLTAVVDFRRVSEPAHAGLER